MRILVLAIVLCSGAARAQTEPLPAQLDDQEAPPHGVERAPPAPRFYDPPKPEPRGQRDAGTALLAIGGGAAAVGGITGLVFLVQIFGCLEGGPGCPSEAAFTRMRNAAIGLFAAGTPIAFTGAMLLAKLRKREPRVPRFSIGPIVTPDRNSGVVLTAAGTF